MDGDERRAQPGTEDDMTANLTTTQNPEAGFHGTIAAAGIDAAGAWTAAVGALLVAVAEHGGADAREVGIFLDSTYGRHFADAVLDRAGFPYAAADVLGAVAVEARRAAKHVHKVRSW